MGEKSLVNIDSLHPSPEKKVDIYFKQGDTNDIISVIMRADKLCAPGMERVAAALKGVSLMNTCERIWHHVHDNIRYQQDDPGYEYIKSPAALWNMRKSAGGDCKSFSVYIASLLQNLGIRYKYRFVSFKKNHQIGHVYIIVPQRGVDILIDAVHDRFNDESPYLYKKDMESTQIAYVHGIGRIEGARVGASVHGSRKQPIPRATPVPWNMLTEGEARLWLLARQAQVYAATEPGKRAQFNQARNMLENYMGRGIHGIEYISIGAGSDPILQKTAQLITEASRMTQSAIKRGGSVGIFGKYDPDYVYSTKDGKVDLGLTIGYRWYHEMKPGDVMGMTHEVNPSNWTNNSYPQYVTNLVYTSSNKGEKTPEEYADMVKTAPRYSPPKKVGKTTTKEVSGVVFFGNNNGYYGVSKITKKAWSDVWRDLELNQHARNLINEKMEAAGHNFLYGNDWAPVLTQNKFPIVAAKANNADAGMGNWSFLSRVSKSNLYIMTETGIKATGAQITPQAAVMALRENRGASVNGQGIGNPAVVVAIIGAVVAAGTAVLSFITKMKEYDIGSQINEQALLGSAPKETDFLLDSGKTGSLIDGVDNNTLLIGGAALVGGAILLSK